MAEERLIDDDKDRKFKIRKNADGEDELVLDESAQKEEDAEEVSFEVPDFESDDEEAAVMTPEQLAAREKMRAEEEQNMRERAERAIASAYDLLGKKKYADAFYALEPFNGATGMNGEICALKLRAITSDFTDFSLHEEGERALTDFKAVAEENDKNLLASYMEEVKNRAEKMAKEADELNAENEEKKGERRVAFRAKRNKTAFIFGGVALPFMVFAVLAIYFGTFMHAVKDGSNITLFIVFIALAGAFFIATVVAAKFFWQSASNLKRNENNLSTKLGRELEEKKKQLEFAKSLLKTF